MTQREIEALRIEALKDKVEALSDMVEILKAERNALAAQVEALQREFKDARATLQAIAGCTWDSGAEEIADIALDESKRWVSRYDDSVLNKTPQQCLRDVQAEAGRAGYLKGADDWKPFEQVFDSDIEDSADEYAESVRKGGAE